MLSQGRKGDIHPPQEEPQACHVLMLKSFLNTSLLSNTAGLEGRVASFP